jgi:hypothetical protein
VLKQQTLGTSLYVIAGHSNAQFAKWWINLIGIRLPV